MTFISLFCPINLCPCVSKWGIQHGIEGSKEFKFTLLTFLNKKSFKKTMKKRIQSLFLENNSVSVFSKLNPFVNDHLIILSGALFININKIVQYHDSWI